MAQAQLDKTRGLKELNTGDLKLNLKQFSCAYCDKRFKHAVNLKIHEGIHTGQDLHQFNCSQCDKQFDSASTLKAHEMSEHLSEKTFSCPTCGKKFNKRQLYYHEKWHASQSVSKFSCTHCDKSFGSAWNLKTHEKTHTNEKPFSCNLCDKKFKLRAHLKRHELIHANSRVFCNQCNSSYQQSNDLKRHIKKVHGASTTFNNLTTNGKENSLNIDENLKVETPYPCTNCDKSFKEEKNLIRHINKRCIGIRRIAGYQSENELLQKSSFIQEIKTEPGLVY